jgi:hypothetical protein
LGATVDPCEACLSALGCAVVWFRYSSLPVPRIRKAFTGYSADFPPTNY